MNHLFIELYLDEDVNVLIADLLRGRGFAATTTLAEKQLQNSDEEQLAYAVRHQKTFLTHNRSDFEALAEGYAKAGKAHYGYDEPQKLDHKLRYNRQSLWRFLSDEKTKAI